MIRRFLYSLIVLLLLTAPAFAQDGTIVVKWEPLIHDALTGYRVYYGTTAGNLTASVEVDVLTTEATVSGLTDRATHYLCVKGYGDNIESEQCSNVITGWPRPRIAAVADPVLIDASTRRYRVSFGGANMQAGATIQTRPVVGTVSAVSVQADGSNASFELTLDTTLTVPVDVDLIVINPDLVYGEKVGAFPIDPYIPMPAITGAVRGDTWPQ